VIHRAFDVEENSPPGYAWKAELAATLSLKGSRLVEDSY
jgi:hypothetical protein